MTSYLKGNVVRLSVGFTDDAGDGADPTGVEFDIQPPADADKVTYTYGEDAELVKDSTGNYHVDWTVIAAGVHWYKFTGTGASAAVEESWFFGDEDRTE